MCLVNYFFKRYYIQFQFQSGSFLDQYKFILSPPNNFYNRQCYQNPINRFEDVQKMERERTLFLHNAFISHSLSKECTVREEHPNDSKHKYLQQYFLGGKGGRCVGLTSLPPSCANCLKIWEPQPAGTLRASPGL
jgi:hypothetical protein